MNKAEEIFRTYFSTDDELRTFRSKYRVVSFTDGDQWGIGSCELHVVNQSDQRMVYEDKPSKIYVTPSGTWYATVAWEHPEGILDRCGGPAAVSVDSKGGVLECYYSNGSEQSSFMRKGRAQKSNKYHFRLVQISPV